ncbi:MAG: Ig-like domain-containing protein [Paraglaciecola sp.]
MRQFFRASLFTVSFVAFQAYGATPSTTNTLPAEVFSGEQVCFDANFSNAGTTGYGPYLRAFIDPEITLDSVSVFGSSVNVTNVGIFGANNTLEDPKIESDVTGTQGDSLVVFSLPAGSVVAGGPALTSEICITANSSADIGVPLSLALQPVYEFGDTATGDNGPIEGASVNANITPTVVNYEVTNNASESERVPGAGFEVAFNHVIDVANGKTLTAPQIIDNLSASSAFVASASFTGGSNCAIDSEPAADEVNGQVQGSCNSIAGSASEADATLSYSVYVGDVLNGATCTVLPITHSSTFDSQFPAGTSLPQGAHDSAFTAKHLAIQQAHSKEILVPGDTFTVTNRIQLSDYETANALTVTDTLADGLTFSTHNAMTISGNVSITPTVTVNGDSTTTVEYDIHSETGDLAGGTEITIVYTVSVDQTYGSTGNPVLANDSLATSTSAEYGLIAGATGCTDGSSDSVAVQTISTSKVILNPQTEYAPQSQVTFRLSMDIPSGDTSDIVFEDYFPLPIFDVADINLSFGVDIVLASTDTANLTPTSITADGGSNVLRIEWPNLSSTETETIAVDVTVTVSDEPFADGLVLTNLFQGATSSTQNGQAVSLKGRSLTVRAPELSVVFTDDIVDDIVDAGDVIGYTLTITNDGGAPAYDVTASSPAATGLDDAVLTQVTVDGNVTTAYSGTLAGGDFKLDAPVPAGSVVVITYTRTVAENVTPRQEIESVTNTVWASNSNATAFPTEVATTDLVVDGPVISTTIDSISPNGDGSNFVVGDTVTYLTSVTLPEGQTPDLSLALRLPAGLSYVASSTSVNTTGFAGTVDTAPTVSTSGTVASRQTINVAFDNPATTTVTEDNNDSNNTFTFTVQALVEDDAANSATTAGQNKRINSSLEYTGKTGSNVTSAVARNFTEHVLVTSTSASPASNLQAGDTVTTTVTVQNTGTAPAYDVVVSSAVNSDIFDLTTPAQISTAAGYTYAYSSPNVTYTLDSGSLAAGDSVTFTYTAVVKDDVQSGATFSVDASSTGDSQDGDTAVERDSSNSGSSNVSTANPTADSISLIASSEAWTADSGTVEFAIGEIATYEFEVTLPEGVTNETGSNSIVEVTLPDGFQYLTNTALVRGEFDTSLTGSNSGALNSSNTSITPTFTSQVLAFDLGSVTNADNDANAEKVIVTFDALILNTTDNNRADTKTLTGRVHYNNQANAAQADSTQASSKVALPNIALTHVATPDSVDGGDTVTYTLTATNTGGTNVTRGWEWLIEDTLPVRLQSPAISSATLSRGDVDIATCASFSGNALTVDSSCLAASERYIAPGESVEVVFTAQVDPAIGFEEEVSNTATVSVTSLPSNNGTGDVTPGTPGSDTGERNGTQTNNDSGQAVNDLTVMTSEVITSGAPTVSLVTSSENAHIGETVTMTATFSIPTGSTDNFEYSLNLPDGLTYSGAPISITLPDNDFSATNSPSTTPATTTNPLVLDFGTITNSASTSQVITIDVDVVVDNILDNQNGTTLEAKAELGYDGASTPIPSALETVTVIEANLDIQQTITAGATGSDAGDTISYQTVITNTSTDATAYSVDLASLIDAGLLGAPDGTGSGNAFSNIVLTNTSDLVVLESSNTPVTDANLSQVETNAAGDTLELATVDFPPSGVLTLTYDVVVSNNAAAGDVLGNDFSASYSSQPNDQGRDGSSVNSDDDSDTLLNNYNELASSELTVANTLAVQSSLNSVHTTNDVTIGDTVTIDLRVDVIEGDIANVIISNELPDGLRFESSSISAGSHISVTGDASGSVDGNNLVTIDLGTVSNIADADNSNDSFIVSIVATVIDDVSNANGVTLQNSVNVAGGGATAGPSTLDIDIVEPALSVSLTSNRESVTLGDIVTYTFTATPQMNRTNAFETSLEVAIPAGLTYVDGSFMGQSVDVSDPTNLEVDFGTIAVVDGAETFTFDARVDNDVDIGEPLVVSINNGVYSSAAGVNADERTYAFTTDKSVVSDDANFISAEQGVVLQNDINGNGFADPGDTLLYTVNITNNGTDATQVTFDESIPANTTYVVNSVTTDAGTADDTSGISVDIGDLTANEAATISFEVTVNGNVIPGTVISAQGVVDSANTVAELTDADANDANGDQPTTLRVGEPSEDVTNLYVSQAAQLSSDNDSDNAISVGDELLMTYVISNSGTTTLDNINLSDSLPDGLSYVANSIQIEGANTAGVVSDNISADIVSLAANDSVVVTLSVTVDSPLVDNNGGTDDEVITLQGSHSSDQTSTQLTDSNGVQLDGYQALNVAIVDNQAGEPDLQFSQTWELLSDQNGNGQIDQGDTVKVNLSVLNQGSANAEGVQINQALPADTQLIANSALVSQGIIVTDEPYLANVGDIAPGNIVTGSFAFIVDDVSDGTVLEGQATVGGDNFTDLGSDDNALSDDGTNPTLVTISGGSNLYTVPTFTLIDTSDLNTDNAEFVQGETLELAISMVIPAGSTNESNFSLVLPEGLAYLANSATLTRVYDTGLSAGNDPGQINSTTSDLSTNVDSQIQLNGQAVNLALGGLINSDNDVNDEQFILTLTLDSDAIIPTQSSEDFAAQAAFSYRDGLGQRQTLSAQNVTLTLLNQLPVTSPDAFNITEDDASAAFNVVSNDTDADVGQTISVASVTSTSGNGVASVSANGTSIEYQPAADFFGTETVNFIVSDGAGGTDVGSVSFTVAGTPDAPVAIADQTSVAEDTILTFSALANDIDVDNDTLTIDSVSVDFGSVSVNGDGDIVYVPPGDFNGPAVISYTVADGTGLFDSTTVSVDVQNVNDLPVATGETATIAEDNTLNLNVLSNDSDVDGDTLSVASVSASVGSASVASNGNVIYTPPADYFGPVTISYTVSDGNGGSDDASISLTVTSVNDAPVANSDSYGTSEDQTVTISVLNNDVDVENDNLNISQISVDVGSLTANGNNTYLYTPVDNFNGNVTINYSITDGNGGTANATSTITVASVNDTPVVNGETATIDEDETLNLDVLSNDSDIDGDVLSIASVSASVGAVSVGSDGNLVFTPPAHYFGPVTISYTVSDGNGGTASSTVDLTVTSVNDAPQLTSDRTTLRASTELVAPVDIDILYNFDDADKDPMSITSAGSANGTVQINSNGSITFVANEGFVGTAEVNVCVSDTNDAVTCIVVPVVVINPNIAPVLTDLVVSVQEDGSLPLSLVGTDAEGDTLTYTLLTLPNGELIGDMPNVIYNPPENFTGEVTFTYQANDGQLDSNIATVTIEVQGENDAPLAVDDVFTLTSFEPAVLDVLANDTDSDGDTLRIVGATATIGEVNYTDSTLTYTPVDGFIGNAIIEYSIEDTEGLASNARAVVTVTPDGVELLPVIEVPEDVFIDATALFTKVDLGVASAVDRFGNPLPVSLVDGVTFYEPGVNTAFWLAEDGEGRQRIASQFVRVRPLVSIEKDQSVLEGRQITIGVHLNGTSPVYPLEVPYSVSGTADGSDHNLVDGVLVFESGSDAYITFESFSDDDIEGIETVIVTLDPSINRGNKFEHVISIREDNVNPDVALFAKQGGNNTILIAKNGGLATVFSDITHPDADNEYDFEWENVEQVLFDEDSNLDTFTFDPANVPVGIYRISLRITDSDAPNFGDAEIIYLEVVDAFPVLTSVDSDGDGIPDDQEGLDDSDRDGIPDYLDAIPECNVLPEEEAFTNGYLVEGDPGVCLRLGNFAIDAIEGGAKILDEDIELDSELIPDPDATNIGGIFDFIAYGLPDVGQAYKIVMPQIRPVPQNAVYRKFYVSTGWFLFAESELNRVWSTKGEPGFCPPPGGDIWQPGLNEGDWCVQIQIVDGGPNDADGIANGTIVDPGGVAVMGVGQNELPVATDDEAELLIDTSIEISVLDNDIDADGDTLTVTSANAAFGEVTFTATSIIYTPRDGFVGEDIIRYGISDGNGGTALGVVRLGVITNKAPIAQDDSVSMTVNQSVTVDVLSNDSDPDGEVLFIVSATAQNGTVVVNNDSTLTYTPNKGYAGTDVIRYGINDADGALAEAQLVITVNPAEVRIENSGGGGGGTFGWMLLLLALAGAARGYQRNVFTRGEL